MEKEALLKQIKGRLIVSCQARVGWAMYGADVYKRQAVGMALANKVQKNDHRIYTLLGDGECEEGQVWEAAMAAAHYQLDNLCAIVDFNGLQIDGDITKVMNPTPVSYTHLGQLCRRLYHCWYDGCRRND